jgi:hypothetical protein
MKYIIYTKDSKDEKPYIYKECNSLAECGIWTSQTASQVRYRLFSKFNPNVWYVQYGAFYYQIVKNK